MKKVMIINTLTPMIYTNDYHVARYENIVETISTDEFDDTPYKMIKKPIHNECGSVFEICDDGWTKLYDYKNHNFEYAVVLGIKDLKLLVYGNKIGKKIIEDNLTVNNNPTYPIIYEFKRGDKLLLEVNKKIRIIHNITVAKLTHEMQQNGPKIR